MERKRPAFETPGERLANNKLHDEEIDVLVPADVMKRGDMRVVQAGDRVCLALEPGAGLGLIRDVLQQDFNGDAPVEPRIASFVDLAHAACADERDDFVMTQTCASRQ